MSLSPVIREHDELIESIDKEREADDWRLDTAPDGQKLDEFWTGVQADLEKDPTWFNFAED